MKQVLLTFEEFMRKRAEGLGYSGLSAHVADYDAYARRVKAELGRARLYARAVLPDEVDEDPPAEPELRYVLRDPDLGYVISEETPNTLAVWFVHNGVRLAPRELPVYVAEAIANALARRT